MKKKFTLIELIVVMAILGVLFSILIPALTEARAKTQIALCKSNLQQFGSAIAMYVISNDDIMPIFRNGTCDAPHEGDGTDTGRIAPGNPALWTYEYLGTEKVYSCPLVVTDQKFVINPKVGNKGLWGTYAYLNYKAPKDEDPYKKYRNGIDAENSQITSVNEKSENALIVDFPVESKAIWYPTYKWEYDYVHFNILMKDNSLKYQGTQITKLNMFLWNKTEWY
ncbi:MAG: type II secretion system GspH family protein [Lentisphaeraceae bacterium]|nr:type II secretion system GspH family protein [Lentisphaeraceae bacterium]